MDSKRKFLEKVVSSGLDTGTITTDDVIEHANPDVLATNLPTGLKAKLISACLGAKKMDTKLVVDTLGTDALAEHMPMGVMWACVAGCAARALGGKVEVGKAEPARVEVTQTDVKKVDEPKRADAKSNPLGAPKPDADAKPGNGVAPTPDKRGDDKRSDDKRGDGKSASLAQPKPNVKAKPSSGSSAKKRTGPPTPPRSATSPVVPKSDFDVDTDIGEDWGVDEIVEVVEEAEIVGAAPLDDTSLNDWKTEEETVNRDSELKRS